MKISNIETYPVWGGCRNYLFVVVDTDEGIYGVGEAGITGRELAVIGAIEHLKPLLIGQDPSRIEHLWQIMFRGGFFPAQRVIMSAISAIDIALWDIKGKALNVPIYDLLGGRVRDKVVCYPHNVGHAMDVEPLVESCLKTKEEGWKFVRWGLPQEGDLLEPRKAVQAAIKQLHAVREAVGDEIEITLRCAHAARPARCAVAVRRGRGSFARTSSKTRCAARTPIHSRRCGRARACRWPPASSFSSKWEFRQLIEEEWIDYARVDLCIVGGFTEAKKIAGWCETHYIKMAVHNPLGPVSSAACLQFNLAVPQLRRAGAAAQARHHADRCGDRSG